jgi:hypothetical protein
MRDDDGVLFLEVADLVLLGESDAARFLNGPREFHIRNQFVDVFMRTLCGGLA